MRGILLGGAAVADIGIFIGGFFFRECISTT